MTRRVIRIFVQPRTNHVSFDAFDRKGIKIGDASLFAPPKADYVHLGELRTDQFGGKGSGATIELIKARIAHAFENNPGRTHVTVSLLSSSERVKRRYRRFGFRNTDGVKWLQLSRIDYERLKRSGLYRHRLMRERPKERV